MRFADGGVIARAVVLEPRRGPRSRRAFGVGDVAGERGSPSRLLGAMGPRAMDPGGMEQGEVIDMSFLDAGVVYEDENLPDHIGEAYAGPQGIRRAADAGSSPTSGSWSSWSRSSMRMIALSSDPPSREARRATAGSSSTRPLAYAWTFRDGKIVHFQSFRDPDEALEAAGLSE